MRKKKKDDGCKKRPKRLIKSGKMRLPGTLFGKRRTTHK